MKNRKLILIVSLVLAMTMSLGGTLAYLSDTDADVNTMVLGNVSITQNEHQRAKNADGTYKTDTIDGVTSYVLEVYENDKPLLPTTEIKADGTPDNHGAGGWDGTPVRMAQIGSYGGMQVFKSENAADKFVTVTNTGKTDAYVRTLVAVEIGTADEDLVGTSYHSNWEKNPVGKVAIDNNYYIVTEYVYKGASDGTRHVKGILPAGDTTYPSLSQVYLASVADNDDMVKLDGNENGKLDILVLSQAIQANGFDNAKTALNAGFGEANETNIKKWFEGWDEDDIGTPGDKWPSNNPPVTVEVDGADKAAVLAAINAAKPGDVVKLTEDTTIAGYNATEKLVIEKAIILDLDGKTLTTECGWGGIDLKGGASIINGTINHTGNTAAIKAFQVEKIENVTINVTATAGKEKGGIVVQNGANDYVGTIKNVTINGATNGIECYRSTKNPAIGVMDNVTINAQKNGIYLNGAGIIGSISNSNIYGGSHGINAYLANLWHISLDIKNSKISGGNYGIDIWDEAATNTGSTVVFNYDDESTFTGATSDIKVTLQEEITCTINGEKVETP